VPDHPKGRVRVADPAFFIQKRNKVAKIRRKTDNGIAFGLHSNFSDEGSRNLFYNGPFDTKAHGRPFDKEAHESQNTLFDAYSPPEKDWTFDAYSPPAEDSSVSFSI